MSRPNGLTNYVLLILKTPADFMVNSTSMKGHPGDGIILDLHTPYSYHNPNGEYNNDWLHFNCSEDTPFDYGALLTNEFFSLPNPGRFSTFIQQLLWEQSYTEDSFRNENIHHIMTVLLNHLKMACRSERDWRYDNPYYPRLQQLRLSMQDSLARNLTIDGLSRELGISPSHFQHLYTRLFGTSFQNDRIQMRVDYATRLLETTNCTIAHIAELCGYTNEVHFYRQFKALTGSTPAAYRRSIDARK